MTVIKTMEPIGTVIHKLFVLGYNGTTDFVPHQTSVTLSTGQGKRSFSNPSN